MTAPGRPTTPSAEQRNFAQALGRSARTLLPHIDWDELSPHLMLGWETSAVAGDTPWIHVCDLAHLGWLEAGDSPHADPNLPDCSRADQDNGTVK